jgi:hypothetical protein
MSKTPPLYCKKQVITAFRIKKSDWYKYRKEGIIPRPIGREGNEDRWQSTVINAIADQMNLLGSEYTPHHTINILLNELVNAEANAIDMTTNNSPPTGK